MRTSKDYFLYCVKDSILLFDVFNYIEELAADYVDYCFEWGLVKDGKIYEKNIRIKEYIQLSIIDAIIEMGNKANKLNCNILCFYHEKFNLNVWSTFFDDPNKFISIGKRILKRKLPNFSEINSNNSIFSYVKGKFDGIPCVILSGEEEEFLTKMKKKLKRPLDKKINFDKI
jgi:hypothetical protein